MTIPLPNLDDRRWADLVDEGRALIPFYAPQWTDHNAHDPGITLIELLAWIAEMDLYQLNRIPDAHRWKFLALMGIVPQPPQPAYTVLALALKPGAEQLNLPAKTEWTIADPNEIPIRLRSLKSIHVIANELKAIQYQQRQQFYDLTGASRRGEVIELLSDNPQVETMLYLGLSQALPVGVPVSFYFAVVGSAAAAAERSRLLQERQRQRQACQSQRSLLSCDLEALAPEALSEESAEPLEHHSVQTVWEFLNALGEWEILDPDMGSVVDDTRSFTLSGSVEVTLPREMTAQSIGEVDAPYFYLRCRVVAGQYDAAPLLETLVLNGVLAEQAVSIVTPMAIAPEAHITGDRPSPNQSIRLHLTLNEDQQISAIEFRPDDDSYPSFRLLNYTDDQLTLDAAFLGIGTGEPWQQLHIPDAPISLGRVILQTQEGAHWQQWELRPDFDASGRSDAHVVLDPDSGIVTAGNGDRGRVFPRGALIFAMCDGTRAEAGNGRAKRRGRLTNSLHNQASISNIDDAQQRLVKVYNAIACQGGVSQESLSQASARALDQLEQPVSAVTLTDCEQLALATPGTQIARVAAKANLVSSLPCLKASGVITVLVLPHLPLNRPLPSLGLQQAVTAYLASRRMIGTRIAIASPTYVEVAVHAKIKACPRIKTAQLQQHIIMALNGFFHPLTGGPEGQGWPFGRDVYRSEVLQVIDQIPGVDYVMALELLLANRDPQCGNLCIGATGLVVAGQHAIAIELG